MLLWPAVSLDSFTENGPERAWRGATPYAPRRKSEARTRSRNCSGVSVGAEAGFGFTAADEAKHLDRKRERPFLSEHRELLPGFLGAAISLDPIWRCHARSHASK
jgi:hypothetical protein